MLYIAVDKNKYVFVIFIGQRMFAIRTRCISTTKAMLDFPYGLNLSESMFMLD